MSPSKMLNNTAFDKLLCTSSAVRYTYIEDEKCTHLDLPNTYTMHAAIVCRLNPDFTN